MTNQTHANGQKSSLMSTVMQNKTAMLITLGSVGAVTALGVGAAAVYNSRQMRTARALKRTGKVLYTVGTTMRNLSSGLNE